jgi:hypothetical protein
MILGALLDKPEGSLIYILATCHTKQDDKATLMVLMMRGDPRRRLAIQVSKEVQECHACSHKTALIGTKSRVQSVWNFSEKKEHTGVHSIPSDSERGDPLTILKGVGIQGATEGWSSRVGRQVRPGVKLIRERGARGRAGCLICPLVLEAV